MKKTCIHLLVVSLIASFCFANLTVFAEGDDLVIDATTITGSNFTVSTNGIECNQFGQYASIGNIDLSLYGSVVFSYASDAEADFKSVLGELVFALTTTGAIQNSDGTAVAEANIVVQKSGISAVASSWVPEDVTVDIDSDYNGEVFFAVYHATPGHCALLKKITFVKKGTTSIPTVNTTVATGGGDPGTAFIMGVGDYYGLRVNVTTPMSGITMFQWTPGGGEGYCDYNVSVYAGDTDYDTSIKGTAVASVDQRSTGDGLLTVNFAEKLNAAEYVIVISIKDISTEHNSVMYLQSGDGINTDDTTYVESYYKAFAGEHAGKTAIITLVTDQPAEGSSVLAELSAASLVTPTEEPEITPTEKPTETPSGNNPSTGDFAGFVPMCFIVIVALALAVILITKKNRSAI